MSEIEILPPVSILMPTYERVRLLPGTIESILSQSYSHFELLIVDDGSNDDTALVIEKIKREDQRVRYVRLNENHGIGFARNAGRRYANGRYIALADSDDLWLSEKLYLQIRTMESHPEIDILFSDWLNVDHVQHTQSRGFARTEKGLERLTVRKRNDNLYVVEGGLEVGILQANFVQPATMILREAVFARVGTFDDTLRTHPDFEFAWRASVLGAKYAYLDRVLLERHKYESSVSAQPIASNLALIKSLQRCYQTSVKTQRCDLAYEIRATKQRAWRRIISSYARTGKRAEAIAALRESWDAGFSLRSLFFLVWMLIAPASIQRLNPARINLKRLVLNGER